MRHKKDKRILNRTSSHRKALLKNLCASLIKHGQLVTTEAKAKELRRVMEKNITKGKKKTLHVRRLINQQIKDKKLIKKLVEEICPSFVERKSGYLRLTKLYCRAGDNAPLVKIEFIK